MLGKFFRSISRRLGGSFSSPRSAKPLSKSRRHTYRPSFEGLENRETPAVNVNLFGNGVLLIQDTDLFAGTNDTVTASFANGQVTITGTGGTVVNGVTNGAVTRFGVIHIVAEFGGGNDALDVAGVTLAGNIDVIGRAGNDSLSFSGNNTLGGRILFLGGDGDNTVNLNGNLTAFGVVDIVNGTGIQAVNVAAGATDRVILGALFVHNGINGTVTANTLVVGNGGIGATDSVTIFGPLVHIEHLGTSASSNVTIRASQTVIGHDLFIGAAQGADALVARNVNVRGNVVFFGHNGNDLVNVQGGVNIFANHFIVFGGDGNNTVNISGDVTTGIANNVIGGNLDISNGVGVQTVLLATLAGDNLTVFGSIFINNGANLSVATPNVFTIGAIGTGSVRVRFHTVWIDHFQHFDTDITVNSNLTVGGNLDLITRGGNDDIVFNANAQVIGNLFVVTEAGNDRLVVGATGLLNVGANVIAFTGIGNDTIVLNGTFLRDMHIDTFLGGDTVHIGTNEAATAAVATTVNGNVGIFLSDGANTVRVNDTRFQGNVLLVGGLDVDLVLLEKIDTGVQTVFNGNLVAFLGASNDRIDAGINGDANDGVQINGPLLLLDGGFGADDELFIGGGVALPGTGLTTGPTRPGNTVAITTNVIIVNFEDFATI